MSDPRADADLGRQDVEWRVRELLLEKRVAKRGQTWFQVFFTLVITPVFAVLGVLVFLAFAPMAGGKVTAWMTGDQSVVYGVVAVLMGMFVAYFLARDPRRRPPDPVWLVLAFASIVFMAAIAVAGVRDTLGILFWPTFIGLGLLALATLGRAYEPKESYYLGWIIGPVIINHPLTFEDDIDRRHFALGFASALPTMVIDAWTDLFAHLEFLRALDRETEKLAVELLWRLSHQKTPVPEDVIAAHGTRRAARVVRTLARLGLVMPSATGLCLTARGREFVAAADGQLG